jgi:hypothetical protein
MNAKSKKTLKAAAMAAGLIALLLPMGCGAETGGGTVGRAPAQGSHDSVVAPPQTVE